MRAPAATPPQQPDEAAQRKALEQILASGVLDRAPNLALMLRYVCEQSFSGRVANIKEYNIAVEALGRDPGFDQKKDAIVRVEAHKLRKRLAEYYRGPGAEDDVRISLPPGTYAPRFEFRPGTSNSPVAVPPEPAAQDLAASAEPVELLEVPVINLPVPVHPLTGTRPEPTRNWLVPFAVLAVLIVLGTAGWWVLGRARETRTGTEAVQRGTSPMAAVAPGPGVRILAGSAKGPFVDQDGTVWSADRYFEGGTAQTVPPRPIARARHPELYLTRREGDFRYRIPLEPGNYEMRLHFAETIFGEGNIAGGGESSRVFQISLNGKPLRSMDVLAEAGGPNIAHVRVFKDVGPGPDGFLTIEFARTKDHGFINGVEVVPAVPGRIHPVRIAARPTGFVTAAGVAWHPDQYVMGGQHVPRQELVAGANDQELFRGERFGNFTYDIPDAAGGRYTVSLHFAERWFGRDRPGGGGDGSRVFDVHCNGRTLLHAFDIHRVAGGPLRAVTRTFHGVEANAQGKIHLSFVPVQNYAMVNGIEVVEEGR